ncbi:DNA polymerase III subunit epsilon [Pedobacter psychrophilus]|uniref:DNA polymerase III subunit epsilon n=1 Tax=Pedobacter psychrophilus TaxID=1826909 RepID=A0A179DGJ3_9SPHI|nr:exonuclease domain-containing protein [Pedobacter psychrophilus]OAQ39583.1 DNA polymerase III subunit epsilon [Pedobacter psychrophilus]
MDNLYAIVDIETTGGHASAHGMTEIAIFIHNGENIIEEYQTLINPFQEIPIFIQSLTGITNEMVSKAPSFEEVAPRIFELLDQKIFVAHNVNFDYSFVNHHLKKEGYTLGNKKLCTVRLARKIFPGLPSYSLGKLSRSLNVPIQNRHRAAGDAFATATIFKMMVQADENGYIQEALKAKAKEEALPPFISRSQIENIPRQPGVYYFKDKKDKIIYVGKAKNLYRRILSHFSNNSPHRNKQDFLREIRKISHQVCGTELQAMILENIEIKRLWPANNSAAKKPERRHCLYLYEDQKGFLRFGVGKKIKNLKPTYLFNSLAESQSLLRKWCEEYGLCPKMCNLQKTTEDCIALLAGNCICAQKDNVADYNQKVNTLIGHLMQGLPSFLIIDNGRNRLEKSCILMEKGIFYGMGYLPEHQLPDNLEKAKSLLQPYPSYQFIEKLIFDFALQNPHQQVILN